MNLHKRILIAEDDPIAGLLLKDSLTSIGYSVTLVENGKQALACFLKTPFLLVITDFDMPEMNGSELIGHLNNFNSDFEPVIFVITSHNEPSVIIDIMLKGVYDYIIKPVDIRELALKLKKAFEFAEMRRLKTITEKERQIRLEGHLDWIKWQERMGGNRDIKQIKNTLFESLKTTFSQGAGFGALVSLIKMVSSSAEKQGEFYKIDAELMDLINVNASMAEKAINTFSEIESLLTNDFECETVSCDKIYNFVKEIGVELRSIFEIKNHIILFSEPKKMFNAYEILINKGYFKQAIIEVLINACKFSESGSKIVVLSGLDLDHFTISVINTPLANSDGTYGIPLSCEHLVFEPFFRLTKFVFDEYLTLDFGLGLPKVEAILAKHNGKVEIRNVIDHSDLSTAPTTKVLFLISIPVVNISS